MDKRSRFSFEVISNNNSHIFNDWLCMYISYGELMNCLVVCMSVYVCWIQSCSVIFHAQSFAYSSMCRHKLSVRLCCYKFFFLHWLHHKSINIWFDRLDFLFQLQCYFFLRMQISHLYYRIIDDSTWLNGRTWKLINKCWSFLHEFTAERWLALDWPVPLFFVLHQAKKKCGAIGLMNFLKPCIFPI